MIERLAGALVLQWVLDSLTRQQLIGCISFEQEPIGWHLAERRPLFGFAVIGIVARQREVRAEFCKGWNHLLRSAKGMQEETAFGPRMGSEQFE